MLYPEVKEGVPVVEDKNITRPLSGQFISVYTTLRILLKMKQDIGLEAMLEYAEGCVGEIEKHNQPIREITDWILEVTDIRRIFNELKT